MLTTILIYLLGGCLLLLAVANVLVFLFPDEDLYSEEAIQKAKAKQYPPLSNLSY